MSLRPREHSPNRDSSGRKLIYWAPVWIPLILFLMITIRGLRPTLQRGRQLERIAPRVDALAQQAEAENLALVRTLEAWQDPMYRARQARIGDGRTPLRPATHDGH